MTSEPALGELPLLFARLHRILLSEEQADRAVQAIASVIKDAVPAALGAGVSLMDSRGRRTSAGATDALVTEADKLQYELGEGPCLTAWASARTVRVEDLQTEDRWPGWVAAVKGMPLRSVISSPLEHEGHVLGALKLYSAAPIELGPGEQNMLEALSVPVAVLLANKQSEEAPRRLSEALTNALQARRSIHFAAGMLRERHGLGSEEAMDLLISTARADRVPLHTAAADILSAQDSHTG